jgi:hypothetical protein
MKPDEAAHEVREHNVFIPRHRLAELLSVIDGELWAPDNETGLKERLAGYMHAAHTTCYR